MAPCVEYYDVEGRRVVKSVKGDLSFLNYGYCYENVRMEGLGAIGLPECFIMMRVEKDENGDVKLDGEKCDKIVAPYALFVENYDFVSL